MLVGWLSVLRCLPQKPDALRSVCEAHVKVEEPNSAKLSSDLYVSAVPSAPSPLITNKSNFKYFFTRVICMCVWVFMFMCGWVCMCVCAWTRMYRPEVDIACSNLHRLCWGESLVGLGPHWANLTSLLALGSSCLCLPRAGIADEPQHLSSIHMGVGESYIRSHTYSASSWPTGPCSQCSWNIYHMLCTWFFFSCHFVVLFKVS